MKNIKLLKRFLSISVPLFALNSCNNSTIESSSESSNQVSSSVENKYLTQDDIKKWDSSAMNLFGRTYIQTKRLVLDHNGTGFEVFFDGTYLKMDVISSSITTYYRVYIDGVEVRDLLAISRNGVYTLAENLTSGEEHCVSFFKCSSTAGGTLQIKNLETDLHFLKPQNSRTMNIEYIGDSITCGAGVLGIPSDTPTFENSDTSKGYAFLNAFDMNANPSIVATEGICVKAKTAVQTNMIEMYKQYSLSAIRKFDFPVKMDFCVIALGTNDADYLNGFSSARAFFKDDYAELINLVRNNNPSSYIICVYGMMVRNTYVETGILDAVNQSNDAKLFSLELPINNDGVQYHPNMVGARNQANTLTNFMNNILGCN